MRRARFILPSTEQGVCAYHCLSRVIERKFVLTETEKERFATVMRAHEAFSGVRVLTFCVMDNHFHLLLEVPPRPAVRPGAEELLARQALLISEDYITKIRDHVADMQREGRHGEVDVILERIWRRMYDLSWFMHGLKGGFTAEYNRRHKRKGTLWEDRFHSVVVESGRALQAMAAYIDLNPVRAGMVKRPEDYRWCGLAEAVAGVKPARAGLGRLMTMHQEAGVAEAMQAPKAWAKDVLGGYRALVYQQGVEIVEENGKVLRRGVTEKDVGKVEQAGGSVGALALASRRVSWFTRGVVVGTKAFVEETYLALREIGQWKRPGAKPKTPMPGVCALRGKVTKPG